MMVLPHNQRVFCNPVLVYALNVFVLHWIRSYDRPTCRYTLSTLAFASSSSSSDRLNPYTLQEPSRKLLTSWTRSFSSSGNDDRDGKGITDTPLPSSSSSSIFDRFAEDFQFSNIWLDLRKKFQNEDLIHLVRDTSSPYSCMDGTMQRIKYSNPRQSVMTHVESPSKTVFLDRFAKNFSMCTGYIVAFRLIVSILSYNGNILMKEITDKLFSPETAKAMKSVWTLMSNVSDHGIVDVFATYPARDVAASILAFSRLQHVSQFQIDDENPRSILETQRFLRQERELIDDLAHYAVFAGVAYGWKLHLLLKQQLHLGDAEALSQRTGIDPRNIVAQNWIAQTHLPAYFIVRDVERERIVLCIRGTLSAKDILTDLCCTAEDFTINESPDNFKSLFRRPTHARAHHGMLESAKGVANATRTIISSQLAENPTYKLVIVGHSLGGGTAAVLGTLWKDTFPGLQVFAYGCPCVGPLGMDPTSNDSIVSVVGEGDPFSCLSLGHLADLSTVIGYLCENADLRNEVLERTANKDESTSEADIKWNLEKVRELRDMMNAEKLFPPGRIIYIEVNDDDLVSIRQAPQLFFRELRLHPGMLDLSRHIPHHYEAALSKIHSKANEE